MGMHASVSPYQTGIYMKSLFFFMILSPGIAAWLVLRVTGFAEVLPLSVKACLFVIYLMYIAAVKAAFSRAPMFDFGLDDLLGIFGKRKESPDIEYAVRRQLRKLSGGSEALEERMADLEHEGASMSQQM